MTLTHTGYSSPLFYATPPLKVMPGFISTFASPHSLWQHCSMIESLKRDVVVELISIREASDV